MKEKGHQNSLEDETPDAKAKGCDKDWTSGRKLGKLEKKEIVAQYPAFISAACVPFLQVTPLSIVD